MDAAIREAVRERAGDRCEYCLLPQTAVRERLQVEHVIAKQHRGPDTIQNLALCCMRCNAHKGPNIAGLDPENGQLTALFNPRKDDWDQHFVWRGAELVGVSPVGRATVAVLKMNEPQRVALREWLIEEGAFPPL